MEQYIKYMICFGEQFEEQTFVGPFDSFGEARIYSEEASSDQSVIVTLHAPEPD